MRFGVCAEIAAARSLARSGYDYIELSVASDLLPESETAEWAKIRRKINAMPIRPEAFNSFVRTCKIVGPEAQPDRLKRYVLTALKRANQVGGSIIVFGSGGAREIPEDYPHDMARKQLLDFLSYCGDASDRYGVVVVIEPLCKQECNSINLVSDGAKLVRAVNRPGVRNLADTYHMEAECEPVSAIVADRDVLAHVHTADSGRFAPGTGTYDHVALFSAIRNAGYDKRVSIECNWNRQFEALMEPALQHLKEAQVLAGWPVSG